MNITYSNRDALLPFETHDQPLIGNTMNIEDLTISQARQLASLFGGQSAAPHPFIGRYVIARCYAAGVHAGTVVSVDGENVILRDSRRLWSWKAADGVALSGLAQHGPKSGGKFDTPNPLIYLAGVCELIPVAAGVAEKINGY
tara:strand:+ start:1231 stop:1659 length:429 start_codon:yes stop_codon:yes gene_type:complete